jgi:hypothetical protein
VRRVLAGAGAELVAAGRLDRAGDIFFLDLRDWRTPHDLRALAVANRGDYERERSRRAIPRVLTSTGETCCSAPTTTPGALIGTAASPGVYEGRARALIYNFSKSPFENQQPIAWAASLVLVLLVLALNLGGQFLSRRSRQK